ncbi:MAG TPA: universal stress protein, partial [Fimbriimonadaceae bacterium]|nr:universal stress protein [Fimbriimonadaceae bacterium]
GSMSPIAEIQRQRREDGERRMSELATELEAKGLRSKSVSVFGKPSHMITEVASAEGADLIVAGSGRKGSLASFIMGSVTRALVVDSKHSILVGKQASGEGTLDAVLATDHSEYADGCVDLLVRLAPRLGKVTVVCADTTDERVREALDEEAPGDSTHADVLAQRNEAVCKKVTPICSKTESVVVTGSANEVISSVMARTEAGLLILGAHGHGYLERLVMGSTAMHMVGNEPWNVLVLRT